MCPGESMPISTSFCQRDCVTRWVLASAGLAACVCYSGTLLCKTTPICDRRLIVSYYTHIETAGIAICKYQTDMWRGRQCFWVKLLLRIKANATIWSNISLSRNFHGLVVDQYIRLPRIGFLESPLSSSSAAIKSLPRTVKWHNLTCALFLHNT